MAELFALSQKRQAHVADEAAQFRQIEEALEANGSKVSLQAAQEQAASAQQALLAERSHCMAIQGAPSLNLPDRFV